MAEKMLKSNSKHDMRMDTLSGIVTDMKKVLKRDNLSRALEMITEL